MLDGVCRLGEADAVHADQQILCAICLSKGLLDGNCACAVPTDGLLADLIVQHQPPDGVWPLSVGGRVNQRACH